MNDKSAVAVKTLPFEYDERRFEKEANMPSPSSEGVSVGKLSIGGVTELTGFSKMAGGLVKETFAEGVDLLKHLTGWGEYKTDVPQQSEQTPQNKQSTTTASEKPTAPDHETRLRTQQEVQDFLQKLRDETSIEQRKQEAAESFRLLGENLSDMQAREEGFLNASIYAKHGIARKRDEIKEETKDREREISIAETKQEAVIIDAAMEGGTGGAKANISATGGGAG